MKNLGQSVNRSVFYIIDYTTTLVIIFKLETILIWLPPEADLKGGIGA